MTRITAVWALSLVVLADVASAGPYSYECEIRGVYQVDDDGLVGEGPTIYEVGDTFHVERETGVILGGGAGNSSYASRQVLDPGGNEMSFKLLSASGEVLGTNGGHNTMYLEVKESAESILKPFVLVEETTFITGVCR